jgi:ribosomal-protein-alanine N-acetyltransferase
MIETERLILKPLTCNQLEKYIKADFSLETELNLSKNPRLVSPALKEALEETILPNVANLNKNYLFSTLWTAISKEDNVMIGDLCFQGEPDKNGQIEIGYGTYEEFQNKGYMTEAVNGLIEWSKKQSIINSIYAETLKDNKASFSILEKNNFIKKGETETLFKWQLTLK